MKSGTVSTGHQVVSREEWLKERKKLLAKEKELTHQRDAVSRARRELPWVKVEKSYAFDSPQGKQTLADLFDGRSQLIVYHFMFGPGWEEGCPSCSYLMDHVDGMLPHLNARDVTFTAVSRAPLNQLEGFKKRMGWRFQWVSSSGTDFNYDYHVSAAPEDMARGEMTYNYAPQKVGVEELPGLSVFYKDEGGGVFHTYSCYARGLDAMVGTYQYLDLTPKGRDEEGLRFSMAWVRYHDRYGGNYVVDPLATYVPPKGSVCSHCSSH